MYCLTTNQHVITPEIIEQKKTIKILYENAKKTLNIELDLIKNYIPIPIKCRVCRHKILSHKKIGDAQWTWSECNDDSIYYIK